RGDRADLLAHPVLQFLTQLLGRFDTLIEGDIDIDALALDVVRHANHSRLGDLRVSNHGALHFGGAHAVTGDVEHVIDTPGDPPVAVLVAARAVTGEVHALEGLE